MDQNKDDLVRCALIQSGKMSEFSEEQISIICKNGTSGLDRDGRLRWHSEVLLDLRRAANHQISRKAIECCILLSQMYSIGAGVDIDPHLTDFYSEKIKEVIYEFERKYDDKQKDPDYLWVILLQYKMYRRSDDFLDTITFRHAISSGRVLFGSLHGMAEKFRDGELIEPDPVIAAELDRLYIRDLKEHCSDGYSKYNKDLIQIYCEGCIVEKDQDLAVRILDEWKSSVMSGQDSYSGCFALAKTLVDYGSSMDDPEVRTAIVRGLDNLIAYCEKGDRGKGYDLALYCIEDGLPAQFIRSDRVWIDRIIDVMQRITKIDMRLCYKLCEIYGKGAIMEADFEKSDYWWNEYETYYTGGNRWDCDPLLDYQRTQRAAWRFPD